MPILKGRPKRKVLKKFSKSSFAIYVNDDSNNQSNQSQRMQQPSFNQIQSITMDQNYQEAIIQYLRIHRLPHTPFIVRCLYFVIMDQIRRQSSIH